MPRHYLLLLSRASVCATSVLLVLVVLTSTAAAASGSFSCRASAARVDAIRVTRIEPVIANPADHPCLPELRQIYKPATLAGIVHVAALSAQTHAPESGASAQAYVTRPEIALPGLSITANLISATADYTCEAGQATPSGYTQFVNLRVNDKAINVRSSDPQHTISLGRLGSLTLNQIVQTPGGFVRRALSLSTPTASVVLGEATVDHSGTPCAKAGGGSGGGGSGGGLVSTITGNNPSKVLSDGGLPVLALAARPHVSPSRAPAGTVLADSGFRPRTDGFSFPNYGANERFENLTPTEMLRLFGDAVCDRRIGSQCTLIPEAQQWMSRINDEMDGGHCYGFSVLSLALFKHQLPDLGSGLTFSLAIQDNPIVQRTIAYTMSQQDLDSVNDRRVTGTPDQILTKLIASLSPSSHQTYTLAIVQRDGTGGHAITPFKVVSRGRGKISLLVYDNNYPGRTRTVSFDVTRDAWSYNAAINPQARSALYDGNAQDPDLFLMPTTPGLGVQPCPFCRRQRSHASSGRSLIQLDGNPTQHAHLMISGSQGRIGITPSDELVNTIPGARAVPVLESDITERREPLYDIPDRPDTITLDAAGLRRRDTESVSSIGPGHSIAVGGIRIAPDERDVIRLSAGDRGLSFTSAPGQHGSPQLRIDLDGAKSDLALTASLLNFHPGATFRIKINADESKITLSQHGNPGTGRYALHLLRYTKQGIKPLSVGQVRLTGSQSVTDNL